MHTTWRTTLPSTQPSSPDTPTSSSSPTATWMAMPRPRCGTGMSLQPQTGFSICFPGLLHHGSHKLLCSKVLSPKMTKRPCSEDCRLIIASHLQHQRELHLASQVSHKLTGYKYGCRAVSVHTWCAIREMTKRRRSESCKLIIAGHHHQPQHERKLHLASQVPQIDRLQRRLQSCWCAGMRYVAPNVLSGWGP